MCLRSSKRKRPNIRGRALGRNDFHSLELIHNGTVIHSTESRRTGDHFTAKMDFERSVDQSGWSALHIPLNAGRNESDKPLFAHTRPVCLTCPPHPKTVQFAHRRTVNRGNGRHIRLIGEQGTFGDTAERESVLQVHRDGIQALGARIRKAALEPRGN